MNRFICEAPYKSLYFGFDGRVSFCCWSRGYVVGQYPKQALTEIWQGAKALAMRQLVSAGTLPPECAICKHHMDSGNTTAIEARNFDWPPRDIQGFPAVMEFELSNICNLRCVMCRPGLSSQWSKGAKQKSPYARKFIEQLKPYLQHLKHAKFLGGEPFLIQQYYEIWEYLVANNPECKLFVQTNGTIMNNKIKDLLKRGNFDISISIDAVDAKTYEQIRPGAKLAKVLANIDIFVDYAKSNKRWLGLACCPMQKNIYNVADVVHYANKLGVPIYMQTVWSPIAEALRFLPAQKLIEIESQLDKEQFPINTDLEKNNKLEFAKVVYQVGAWAKEQVERVGLWQGKTSGNIDDVRRALEGYKSQSGRDIDVEKYFEIIRKNISLETIPKFLAIPMESIVFELNNLHKDQIKLFFEKVQTGLFA